MKTRSYSPSRTSCIFPSLPTEPKVMYMADKPFLSKSMACSFITSLWQPAVWQQRRLRRFCPSNSWTWWEGNRSKSFCCSGSINCTLCLGVWKVRCMGPSQHLRREKKRSLHQQHKCEAKKQADLESTIQWNLFKRVQDCLGPPSHWVPGANCLCCAPPPLPPCGWQWRHVHLQTVHSKWL